MSQRLSISGFLRPDENEEKIQRVMTSEGVSIQVARNLLKAGKLGVGPAAQEAQGGRRPADRQRFRDEWRRDGPSEPSRRDSEGSGHRPPPKPDKKAAAQAMAEKLRKLEEEQEEQELRAERAKKDQLAKKRAGMKSLGPVSTRSEMVDPFKIKEKAVQEKREMEEQRRYELEQARKEPTSRHSGGITFAPLAARPEQVKAAVQAAREEEEEDFESDHDDDAQNELRGSVGQRVPVNEDRWRQIKKRRRQFRDRDDPSDDDGAARNKRARSTSPDAEEADQSKGASSSANSSLMSEAEIMAKMKKDKRTEGGRGSVRAQARIQREIAEWEQSKQSNANYWKPPKFALVLGSGRDGRR